MTIQQKTKNYTTNNTNKPQQHNKRHRTMIINQKTIYVSQNIMKISHNKTESAKPTNLQNGNKPDKTTNWRNYSTTQCVIYATTQQKTQHKENSSPNSKKYAKTQCNYINKTNNIQHNIMTAHINIIFLQHNRKKLYCCAFGFEILKQLCVKRFIRRSCMEICSSL